MEFWEVRLAQEIFEDRLAQGLITIQFGTPPPPTKCGQTENITSRHPSDVGGKNVDLLKSFFSALSF